MHAEPPVPPHCLAVSTNYIAPWAPFFAAPALAYASVYPAFKRGQDPLNSPLLGGGQDPVDHPVTDD